MSARYFALPVRVVPFICSTEKSMPIFLSSGHSLDWTVLEEASAEPAEERPANNNEGFFD